MTTVLITGMSGCGKSTVASAVVSGLGPNAKLISQDDFFACDFVPYAESLRRGESTIEGHEHVDFPRLIKAIQACVEEGKVAVVEGHVLLCNERLVAIATHVFYLTVTAETCRSRRVGRKIRTVEEQSILERYFETFVVPSHFQNVVPLTRQYADKLTNVDNSDGVQLKDIVQHIVSVVKKSSLRSC